MIDIVGTLRRGWQQLIAHIDFPLLMRAARGRVQVADAALARLSAQHLPPGAPTEALQRRVGDRLPHVALVELGVARERDDVDRGIEVRALHARGELARLGVSNVRLILNGVFRARDAADPTAEIGRAHV